MTVRLGETLCSETGTFFLVVGKSVDHIGYVELVEVPAGMTAQDFGRRFRHIPLPMNPTRYEIIKSL